MIKRPRRELALHWTGLLQRIIYGWILVNLSCYGMLCEVPELGLDWDCFGLDAIRYDTIRHDTVHVCMYKYL